MLWCSLWYGTGDQRVTNSQGGWKCQDGWGCQDGRGGGGCQDGLDSRGGQGGQDGWGGRGGWDSRDIAVFLEKKCAISRFVLM